MSQLGTDRLPPGLGISQHRAFIWGPLGKGQEWDWGEE